MRVTRSTLLSLLLPLGMVSCANPSGGTSANGAYHDTAETWEELRSLAAQYPDRARAFSLGRSWEGREIPALEIGEAGGDESRKPNIYLLGGMHAREWIGVEVPLGFARSLLELAPRDPAAERLLQRARFYIVPVQNPDGLEYAIHTDRTWYKTRRDNGDGSWGVQLNCNYPPGWDCIDLYPASPSMDPKSELYRGTAPFSEPESQAIRDFMLTHPPAGLIDYHSYGTIIYSSLPRVVSARDIELWHIVEPEMARRMLAVNGRFYTSSGTNRSYRVGDLPDPSLCGMLGQLFNWTRDRFGTSAFLIELPPTNYLDGAGFVPESQIEGIVAEQTPATLYLAGYVTDGLHGP